MRGTLTYISVLTLVGIWVLGWLGLTLLLGAFFDLPAKGTSITGALLGPLGFIAILLIGIASKKPHHVVYAGVNRAVTGIKGSRTTNHEIDPFG
jgi:hypothetical protein